MNKRNKWALVAQREAEALGHHLPDKAWDDAAAWFDWRGNVDAEVDGGSVRIEGDTYIEHIESLPAPTSEEMSFAVRCLADMFGFNIEADRPGRVDVTRIIAHRDQFGDMRLIHPEDHDWSKHDVASMLDQIGGSALLILFMAFAIWGTF